MITFNHDIEFIEKQRECSYFKDYETSDIKYRLIHNCTKEQYLDMLQKGWRRFGKMHFVPICESCTKCTSMRIVVDDFKFSKSQKRVLNKNKDTKVFIQPPSVSYEHIELYNKYHEYMSDKKGWSYNPIEIGEYIRSYVDGKNSGFAREILYFDENKLIGVALVDILDAGISAIYCYYDHDYEERSIGQFSILFQIKIAQELNIPYIYLGYWIKDHFSMGYKEKYHPFEILKNRPDDEEKAIWELYEK
ncbi:arginyltransferase [Arcobacter sp. FWKO B]|uniref:arginyltransferase n=1 Tax=Arcobacter sp. FWKO B TaxID=2593672 RepID=UPI0018A521B7|nr:arginyltransferase [Arcobacter sp. FWKO B]QOG13006.1 arginyltransferase [Arcobacter sp. FWKO B]